MMNKYVYGKCCFSIAISCRCMSLLQYVILLFSYSKWFQFRKIFLSDLFSLAKAQNLERVCRRTSAVVRDIYNASTVQGYIPSQLKEAVVVPIPKCSSPKSVEDDLRPIQLTSQLAEVLESFTFKSLFLPVRDQLDDKQFAIAGKSTTHALFYFLHLIFEGLDNGDMYARIFYTVFSK